MLHALFELYRRTLWLVAACCTLAVLIFALVPSRDTGGNLPRFLNPRPKNISNYAWTLSELVASGGTDSTSAAQELARLGGAALPHVLPKLDSLSPEGRLRVLNALVPVALRMDVQQGQASVSQLSGTWLTFLSDNAVYLHPAMARRVVQRFLIDPTAQHAHDVRRLDTFALRELVNGLRRSTQLAPTDDTLVRLVELLRQITGHDTSWAIEPGLNPTERDGRVARWEAWWSNEKYLFEVPTATARLMAPVVQTQFARWLKGIAQPWLHQGLLAVAGRAPWLPMIRTGSLFLLAVFGGSIVARLYWSWLNNHRTVNWVHLITGPISMAPFTFFAAWAHFEQLRGMLWASTFIVLAGASFTVRPLARWLDPHPARSARRPDFNGAMHTTSLSGVCLVTEWAFQVDGLGQVLINATKEAQPTPIVGVALVNTLLIALVQYLNPRMKPTPA